MKLPSAIFVTGTDTGVGKTLISSILVSGLKAAYWKPIQSGRDPISDTEQMKVSTGLPPLHFFPEVYSLSQPLSPHAAAAIDGVQIEIDKFRLPDTSKFQNLIVEGAGGVMVPINDHLLISDLILHLKLPTVIVTRSTLGTINHTLLTLEHLRSKNIEIFGVVMNGPKNELNRRAIEYYSGIRVLAEIEPLATVNKECLEEAYRLHFEERHDNRMQSNLSNLAPVYADENLAGTAQGKVGQRSVP